VNQSRINNALAEEMLESIDSFIAPTQFTKKTLWTPPIISIPLFKSRKLRARIMNRLTYIPLRLVRRSTTEFWGAQKQVDYKLLRDIETLRFQIKNLQHQIDELKRGNKDE
jgi:hypothetical protein